MFHFVSTRFHNWLRQGAQTRGLSPRIHGVAALCAVFLLAGPLSAQEKNDGLPLRQIVMFNSGVAFYQHAGTVTDDAQIDLKFNVDDINDLLKSMVVQDLGGGHISTVSYNSKDPLTRTLKTFAIDLTEDPSLAELLKQVRGEEIEIEAPEKITGLIVGVETRTRRIEDTVEEISQLTLLTDGGLRRISLEDIGRIKLTNPQLNAELRQALAILALGHATDKKTVSLHFLGKGQRQVRVGYIQEAPVWKTSYRLVLQDDKPLLQGWAIVENTTESDWKDVSLTLVSGRPISFTMDLYQPLYNKRPVVQMELYSSLMPQLYETDMLDLAEAESKDKKGQILSRAAGRRQLAKSRALASAARKYSYAADAPMAGMAGGGGAFYGQASNLAVQAAASASEVGELFQYVIDTPVTLDRRNSAMLPIVNEEIEGEKVSIYNARTHAKHPLNGVRLKNTTKLDLMQGPITVFDGGSYAGDAKISHLKAGGERLISYALDLALEVAPETKMRPQQLVSCRIVKGVVYTQYKLARSQIYKIKSTAGDDKTVLIEHPFDASWKLIEPQEPSEKTRNLYRFAVAVKAGESASLTVREERTLQETVSITNLDDGRIRIFLAAQVISPQVKAALQEVVKRKNVLAAIVQKRSELQRQIKVITTEQERIRKNMGSLPKDSDLFRRYVQKFTQQEDQNDRLRETLTASIADEAQLREQLNAYIAGLNIR